jgi:mono/diheme cytochrome c family protein
MRARKNLLSTALVLAVAVTVSIAAAPAGAAWKVPAEAAKAKNPVAPSKESVARGEAIYKTSCLDCHGPQGRGDGKQAKGLSKKPADLAAELHEDSDGEIFWKVSEGKRPMPGFKKDLKEDARWDVVNYLRQVIQAPAKDAPADTTKGKATPPAGAEEKNSEKKK